MVTKAPEKLINLLWFLSLSWLAIVYRLLKNIKWPMTTQDVNVAKCLGTSNQADKIVLDPLQTLTETSCPAPWSGRRTRSSRGSRARSRCSSGSPSSRTRSWSPPRLAGRLKMSIVGRSYSPRAHVEGGVHAQYFLRPEKCQQCRGLCKTRNTAFNVHFKTSTYLFHNIAKINAIRVDCRT